MRSFAPIAFAAVAAALPGGAPDNLKPEAAAPAGCVGDYSGSFGFSLVNVSSTEKRSLMKRDAAEFTLSGGIMKDSKGRIADVVNNQQLQFDGPPAQAGAIYDAGFAVCPNNTLVLGDFTTWKACLSGGFYNIYLKNDAPQCHEVYIEVVPMGASAPAGGAVGAKPDGQPTGGAGASQITDGQVQAPTGVSQIGDGQIQAPTNMASQITDGQIQVPTVLPAVSQISDGQIQAPTKPAAVSQISDGQLQAPTKPAAVSQISDGQIQAPTATAAVSQISDGQVQAPTAAVSQIGDGQIQAPTNGTTAAKPSAATQQTSSGVAVRGDLFALFGAGLMAVLLL